MGRVRRVAQPGARGSPPRLGARARRGRAGSPALRDEISRRSSGTIQRSPAIGCRACRIFSGRPIRHGTWYPDYKLRLGRRSRGLRAEGGRVHEVMVVDGSTERLKTPLIHHPYRDLSDALRKASTYARLGAQDRFDRGARGSAMGLFVRPARRVLSVLVLRAGFLDGPCRVPRCVSPLVVVFFARRFPARISAAPPG